MSLPEEDRESADDFIPTSRLEGDRIVGKPCTLSLVKLMITGYWSLKTLTIHHINIQLVKLRSI